MQPRRRACEVEQCAAQFRDPNLTETSTPKKSDPASDTLAGPAELTRVTRPSSLPANSVAFNGSSLADVSSTTACVVRSAN
jgi:hypothetical protein